MGHIRAYTNPRTVLDSLGFRQFYLKRPGERLVLAGEVNHQLEVVIVHIDGLHKIPYDSLLEFLVPVILGAEHEQVFNDVIAPNRQDPHLLGGDQSLQLLLFHPQLRHPVFELVRDDSHLHGAEDVGDLLLCLFEPGFIVSELGLFLHLFRHLHGRVRDPLHGWIVQGTFQNRPRHFLLDLIAAHVLLVALLLKPLCVAGVVKEVLPPSALAGDPDHRPQALAAEDFPRQQVFPILTLPCVKRLPMPYDMIHSIIHLFLYQLRHPALDADVAVKVHAGVAFVFEDRPEGRFPELLPMLGAVSTGIQIPGDVRIGFIIHHPAEYLLDDWPQLFINGNLAILALLVAIRQRPDHFSLGRAVHQAAPDILCHVVRVKLVDGHHHAEHHPAGGIVAEVLLAVDHLHASIFKARLIPQRVIHIPGDAV